MNTKYPVTLNEEQRQYLEKITSSGKMPARQMKRAQILLKSAVQANWSYEQIMQAFDVTANTVAAVRRTFVERSRIENTSMFWTVKGKPISLLSLAANHRPAESIGVCVSCRIGL